MEDVVGASPTLKFCVECGEFKQLEEFYRDSHGILGRASYCIPCRRAYRRRNARRRVPVMPWVSKERDRLIMRLVARDGSICKLCGGALIWKPGLIHVDHRHPRFLGGDDRLSNLQLAHRGCNLSKRAKLEDEYRDWVIVTGRDRLV